MNPTLKQYGTEGPLGIPMLDAQAFALDQLLGQLPAEDRVLRRSLTAKAPAELLDGERADVSWISTESIDSYKEVVRSRGMNDAHFRGNPIVTLQHCYWLPPIGRSLWRKRARDGDMVGIKAKTQYPARPADWPDPDWQPDSVFSLIKAGLLNGKSIGFISLKAHSPTPEEIKKESELANCNRIIDEWLLVEYAVTPFPANLDALTEQVSKSGLNLPSAVRTAIGIPEPSAELSAIAFTSMDQITTRVKDAVSRLQFATIFTQSIQNALDRVRGRV
jgi:hypothetical protein